MAFASRCKGWPGLASGTTRFLLLPVFGVYGFDRSRPFVGENGTSASSNPSANRADRVLRGVPTGVRLAPGRAVPEPVPLTGLFVA